MTQKAANFESDPESKRWLYNRLSAILPFGPQELVGARC